MVLTQPVLDWPRFRAWLEDAQKRGLLQVRGGRGGHIIPHPPHLMCLMVLLPLLLPLDRPVLPRWSSHLDPELDPCPDLCPDPSLDPEPAPHAPACWLASP